MIDEVRSWLGWPVGTSARLTELAEPSAVFDPPVGADARDLLARLHVPPHAIDEIVEGTPSRKEDPEAWWLLERLYERLRARSEAGYPPPWPAPVPADDPLSRYFHLYVFLAAVPDTCRLHESRGVPEEIVWSTLADVGLQIANYETRHGRPGFDGAFWIWSHFRGGTFQLGRLQFDLVQVDFDADGIAGLERGDPSIGVHIPALGPLTPSACDDSFEHARTFFPLHFPERTHRLATCRSWLLDEQLSEYLPPTANIIRFQRRFTLVPGHAAIGDDDVVRFVFGHIPDAVEDLPQRTTLEKAVVTHLTSGRHWYNQLGWLEI